MNNAAFSNVAWKIETAQAWDEACAAGIYHGSALDLRDGFIHLSAAAQTAETLALHFAGRTGLVLIRVDLQGLGDLVKWEASRGGTLFPHVYGPLTPADCGPAMPLPLDAAGTHILPDGVA